MIRPMRMPLVVSARHMQGCTVSELCRMVPRDAMSKRAARMVCPFWALLEFDGLGIKPEDFLKLDIGRRTPACGRRPSQRTRRRAGSRRPRSQPWPRSAGPAGRRRAARASGRPPSSGCGADPLPLRIATAVSAERRPNRGVARHCATKPGRGGEHKGPSKLYALELKVTKMV